MSDMSTSFVNADAPRREPKTDAERQLLEDIQLFFAVYEFSKNDRISLARSIIAALDAAEQIGGRKTSQG